MPYGRVRLACLALKTLTPRFTDFFTDFEKKNPIVLQSAGKNIFLTSSRRKTYNTVKHQYYAVKSQYHLVQSPIQDLNLESTVFKKNICEIVKKYCTTA